MIDKYLFKFIEWVGNMFKNCMVLVLLICGCVGESCVLISIMGDYYMQCVLGGLLIIEVIGIFLEVNGWVGVFGIYIDEMVQGWKVINECVYKVDGKIVL